MRLDVLDLITAVTPLRPDVPVIERHAWFERRKETLERLETSSVEHGREALREFHARPDTFPEIRAGLLHVAAHAAPEDTRELLVELVTRFGDNLFVRTRAAALLGETSPETAVEVLEPILRGERDGVTYPPKDLMLEAWSEASLAVDHDRVPLLCEVATHIKNPDELRHKATRLLGELPSPQGRQALERLLVESSGNSYVRRLAAQSLAKTVTKEDLCPLFTQVLSREADPNFIAFLDQMLLDHCR